MDMFRKLEREAREHKRGLWGKKGELHKKEDVRLKGKFVGSKKSNKFHKSECKWAKKIKPNNLVVYSSVKEAIQAGREPCKVCNSTAVQGNTNRISQKKDKGDETVYVTKSGKKYHRAGCIYIRKSKTPRKLKNARKRYSPCSVCNTLNGDT